MAGLSALAECRPHSMWGESDRTRAFWLSLPLPSRRDDSMFEGKICGAADIKNERFKELCYELKEEPKMHRKLWEWYVIVSALEQLKLLKPGSRGLGFGVGIEPIASYFASKGCEIVATDFSSSWWSDWSTRLNERMICDPIQFSSLVSTRDVDMNWIPDDLRGFDFCWSCCSMDHLGSIRLGKRFVYNSMQCLVDNGIAIHTGEYNLESDWNTIDYKGTVLWTSLDVEECVASLNHKGHRSQFTFHRELQSEDLEENQTNDIHMQLRIEGFASTSFSVIAFKNSCLGAS